MTTIGEALGNRHTTRVQLRVEPSHVLMNEPRPPVFRHCWECMFEVTPSGRCVVDRYTSMVDNPGEQRVLLVPVAPEAMQRICEAQTRMERSVATWDASQQRRAAGA